MVVNPKKNKSPVAETYLSLLILLVLAGIGTVIFLEQFRYNPAVFQGSNKPSGSIHVETTAGITINHSWAAWLPDMVPLTAPEVFDEHNLSDKINGKAELYLSAGFKQLKTRRFKIADDSDTWMEIFVYNMESLHNAFAVFSAQRRENAVPTRLARFSYRTENALFLIHGPFYVEIIGARATENLFEQMSLFSRNFVKNTRVIAGRMEELDLFPVDNLEKNSVALISANGFGYDRFNRIFTANYTEGEIRLTAFISRRESPAEAKQAAKGYQEFLTLYGGKIRQTTLPVEDIKVIEIMGSYELVFYQGPYLAGIHEASDLGLAEELAVRLSDKLKEGVNAG